MKYFIYLLLIILLCGLTAGAAPFVRVHGQAPNLLFLLVVVWSLDKANSDFLFMAFLSGLFLDFYSGQIIGSFTLPLLLVSMLLHLLSQNYLMLELNLKYLVGILLPAQLLLWTGFLAYSWLFYKLGVVQSGPPTAGFIGNFIAALIYNLIFLYPIYALCSWLKVMLARYVEKEYKAR